MPDASLRLRPLRTVLVLLVLWRAALFAVDLVGTSTTSERPYNRNANYRAFPGNYFLDGWFRWDTGWYKRIAERGYFIEGRESNVAFFPAFPYAARWVGKAFGSHWIGGLVVSHVCLFAGLVFLYRLALHLFDEHRARLASVFFLSFPGSFFLSAYLSEAMFFAAAAGCTYFYVQRRFRLAGILGLWATLTRSAGAVLFAAIAIDYAYAVLRRRERFSRQSLFLLLMPWGVPIFMLVLWAQVGDPLAFIKHSNLGWGRTTAFPLVPLWEAFAQTDYAFPRGGDGFNTVVFVEAVFGTIFLLLPFFMIGRLPVALWTFSLFAVVLPLASGNVASMVRYCAVVFPVPLWLADATATRPVAQWFLIYLFALFLAIFNVRFMNWYWIG
jgi:hypothetical protein